jgi:hypothetical protein
MGNRTAALSAAIRSKREEADAVVARRKAKRVKERPVAALHDEWVVAMRGLLGADATVPPWAGEDWSLAKKLIGDIGFDKAVDVIRHFVGTWEARRRKRDAVPGMKLCWTIRQRLLGEVEGKLTVPKSKAERLMRGEYRGKDNSPKTGWGSWDD